jgi:acyl-CoA synthetase (AMP-forming)/AMP-acid ligase II
LGRARAGAHLPGQARCQGRLAAADVRAEPGARAPHRQALLERGLSAERPLAILSGNDLEHALLAFAAQHVGVPYAPISPAYSLISQDFGKLRYIMDLLKPGLVFAASGQNIRARSRPR